MKRVIRLALLTSAAVVSLAFTSSAWASYSPSLTVTGSTNKPGAATSLLLGHIQSDADDPTAKDTIYVPLGYGVNLSQPVGTKIGDISGDLILRDSGGAQGHGPRRVRLRAHPLEQRGVARRAAHHQVQRRPVVVRGDSDVVVGQPAR